MRRCCGVGFAVTTSGKIAARLMVHAAHKGVDIEIEALLAGWVARAMGHLDLRVGEQPGVVALAATIPPEL